MATNKAEHAYVGGGGGVDPWPWAKLINRKISKEELQARWIYSELGSQRFAEKYQIQHKSLASVIDKAQHKKNFDELSSADAELLKQINSVYRRDVPSYELRDYLNNVHEFICMELTKHQLWLLRVVPGLGSELFNNFASSQPCSANDPRLHVPTKPFEQEEPIIVVRGVRDVDNNELVLLDGTMRALWCNSDINSHKKVLAWVDVTCKSAFNANHGE